MYIIYVFRDNDRDNPAQRANWYETGPGFITNESYTSMCRDMAARWRFRHDEREAGDMFDWIENGPFHAMRYYTK